MKRLTRPPSRALANTKNKKSNKNFELISEMIMPCKISQVH